MRDSSSLLFAAAVVAALFGCANAAISIQAPSVAVTKSDIPLSLTSASFDAISIAGELDTATHLVKLHVNDGAIQLAQETGLIGLVQSTSSTGDAQVEFRATTADANAALDGLVYTPPSGYAGRPTFTVSVLSETADPITSSFRVAVNEAIENQGALVSELLDGVTEVHSGVSPGHMIAFGPTAYNVTSYPHPVHHTMIAAATYGKGKVIAMPDHQMLDLNRWEANSLTFFLNGLDWLTDSIGDKTKTILTYRRGLRDWMVNEKGYSNAKLVSESTLIGELETADVFVGWLGPSERQENLEALKDFAAISGKGLFIAEYGTGYEGYWWNRPISKAPGNVLLREAGIAFGKSHTSYGGAIKINTSQKATDSLQTTAETMFDVVNNPGDYSSEEWSEVGFGLSILFEAIPEDDPLFARLGTMYEAIIDSLNPTPDNQVTDAFEKSILQREARILVNTPPEQVVAHRTAEAIYGTIPPNAPRVTKTVQINTDRSMWLPTGLYAAPGDLVTVTVPEILVNRGYNIRINAHVEDISGRKHWLRPPQVHRYFPIDSTEVKVANAFGGSILIDFGSRRDDRFGPAPGNGMQDFTISNAIEQPYFVLGTNTDQEWLDTIKNRPAPVAVFECNELVIIQKASDADGLTRPTELMNFWQEVSQHEDYMGSYDIRGPRVGPDLIDIDVQTNAGSANAGYPITAWDSYWGNMFDLDRLLATSSWGDFHELGHNHQRKWWTWSGDGEVTVNIFSAYVLEAMGYASQSVPGWGWTLDRRLTLERAIDAVKSGSSYSGLKAYRLPFWVGLAHGFGWESMRNVIRSYEIDEKAGTIDWLSSQSDRKCEWLKRYSKEVNRDLRQYMVDTWKLEVTELCESEVASLGLTSWMPAMGSQASLEVLCDTPASIDLSSGTLSFDGVADVTALSTDATSGSLTSDGQNYIYTPRTGFRGTDTFSYSVRSSTGDEHETTVMVDVGNFARLVRGGTARDFYPSDDIVRGRTMWDRSDGRTILFYCTSSDRWVETYSHYRQAIINNDAACGGISFSISKGGEGTGEFFEYDWGEGNTAIGTC